MTDRSGHIDEVCHRLKRHYIFPEVAEQISTFLRSRFAAGAYDGLDDESFAPLVTTDLQSVNGDKHVRLRYHLDPVPDSDEEAFDVDAYRAEAALNAYGIARAERLPGNIGHLDTRKLYEAASAGPAIAAAMGLLAKTDALIIDVRRNGGGDPDTVALLCTYLFDGEKHLNDIYFREGDRTKQFWTLPYVPGPKYGERKPVWVLTGPNTFSGAEDLSYTLQQLDRAKTVGEATKGGAHPRGQYKVDTHLDVTVSYARSINPYSKGNWEGGGVQPDIPMPADDAFDVAYRLALEHVLALGDTGVRRLLADEARLALSELS
ncbi:S41 family peptidase [Amycolatopsis sp.]|jgi:C-terminal processing protease CtpA/Prc|uniref:S41 family peptidase n=1 Tax=Amycolatopsis sp. TaxID=37632 RepID=UPI002DFCCF68|nr:S41 family peptidase [Amycolatopsis sp.]